MDMYNIKVEMDKYQADYLYNVIVKMRRGLLPEKFEKEQQYK